MSYYYNYFLGYQRNDNGLFYPLGPYDMNGTMHNVLSRSRSFASDLHERFYLIPKEKYSVALEEEFRYEDYSGKAYIGDVRFAYLGSLPSGSYIRKGYFLIDDIIAYERGGDIFELFYDYIPLEVYAQRMQNELTFGPPKPKTDEFGEEYEVHSCKDYAYYAYPDYTSEEYETWLIRNAIDMYEYGVKELDDSRIVVLETEG